MKSLFFDTLHVAATGTNNSLTHYSPVIDLTPNIHNGGNSAVAVSSQAIHVVWEQEVGSTFRIFYRRGEFIQKDVSFSLSTGLLEKKAIPINTTASDTVWVSNSGTDTLVIGTAISTDENFTVVPPETTVTPGTSTAIAILFTPKTIGEHSGKIIFYHNGNTSPDCITVTTEGKWQEEQIAYTTGWNLLSIPMRPGPVQTLPSLFAYDNGYVQRDTLLLGVGYWAKLPSDSTVTFQGVEVLQDTFDVTARWNIVGSLTAPVAVGSIQTIPDSIIASSFYGYSNKGYFTADTLYPGRAYWVKVKQDGRIILKGTMIK